MKPIPKRQKIAIIGSGVAGMTAAWLLNREHDVQIFEKNDYLGGHTRTLKVAAGADLGTPVDTGYIVMNHRNYPCFTKVLEELGVELADSTMSFSYYDLATDYGYAGNGLRGLFPKAAYLAKPDHLRLLRDLWRFARIGYADLQSGFLDGKTLHEYCLERNLSEAFRERYLYPMGAAIWSSPVAELRRFPAQPYLHFLENHGLLRLHNRPQWKYIPGGSRTYIERMRAALPLAPKTQAAVHRVERNSDSVNLHFADGSQADFDQAVIATHADQALALVQNPTAEESKLLSPWRYQDNQVTLHTHAEQLPRNRALWSAWNFVRSASDADNRPVAVTYYMNQLQKIQSKTPYLVTLNQDGSIPDSAIINSTSLAHPLYDFDSLRTQDGLVEMNGRDRLWFCGSYFGYGFHEDAVRSAVQVANKLGILWNS
jgi:predicted NAD/FAD-binding protein